MVNLSVPSAKKHVLTTSSEARKYLLRDLKQEQEEDKWYAGDVPTSSETLARIYTISQQDPQKGQQLWDEYNIQTADPSSPLYNPYLAPTNNAVSELSSLGFDMSSGINDTWLEQNSWLKNYYRTGTSGSPLAPSSESTAENDAAYWYYKVLDAEETTQKAEAEWAALQEELTYWTWRPDRNYSDEEVLAKVDWSKYPTLQKMDEGLSTGVPVSLNRSIGYSQDALRGVIWAARNNGGTGSTMFDSVSAVLGRGDSWVQDEEISLRLDPSSDQYNPYLVGSTLDEAGLYFGMSSFDAEWLEENKDLRGSTDLTARQMYEQVYEAEQLTQKAEAELTQLVEDINQYLSVTSDADRILSQLDMSEYPTLQKMDKSLESGELLGLTRAVGYGYKDIEAEVRRLCTPVVDNSVSEVLTALGGTENTTETYTAVREAKNARLDSAGLDVFQAGTEAEKIVFQTARDSGFNASADALYTAILSGSVTPDTAYQDSLAQADSYAGSAYIQALEGIRPYEKAVADKAEAEKELAALLQEKPWLALYTQSPVKPAGTTAADIVSAYASQYDSQTVSNALYDMWRKVDSLVHGTPYQEGYVGYADLGESEWERMESQFNSIDWSEGAAAYELQQRIASLDAEINELRPAYEEGLAMAEDVQRRYASANQIVDAFGGTLREGYDTTALLDYAYEYGADYKPTEWSAYTLFDGALAEGYSAEEVALAAERSIAVYEAHLADVETVLSELDARGAMPDGAYRENLEREAALMRRNITDAKYYLLREEEDFEQIVEETRAKVSEAWESFNLLNAILPKSVSRGGYSFDSYLMVDPFAPVDPSSAGNTPWQSLMTEEERDTYLYILGTKGENAAAAYFSHLKDGSYGVLHTRASQQMSDAAQIMASGGLVGDSLATAITVLMSPMKLEGALYTALAGFSDAEINPNNVAFGVSTFSSTLRSEVKQDITDTFGEGTAGSFFANLGYDVITSAADSTVNAVTFGAASPITMGLGAAGEAAQDVKFRGGNDTQALQMAGITAFAETATELITVNNMRKMFNMPPLEFKKALVQVAVDMGEEAAGEAINETFTSLHDAEIMGELSSYAVNVQSYMDEGLSQEEAERRAARDGIVDILYAGLTGAASGGVTSGGAAVAGRVTYRAANAISSQQGLEAPVPTAADQATTEAAPVEQSVAEVTEANETTETAESAPVEEETAETAPQSPPVAKDYSAANAMEALSIVNRMVDDGLATESHRTAVVAATLGTADQNGVTPTVVAAAEAAVHRYGGATLTRTVVRAITETAANNMPVKDTLGAVTVAALVDGEARVALDKIVNDGVYSAEAISNLIQGAAADMATRATEAQAAVADSMVANRVKDKIAEGALDGIRSYDAAVSQAQENLDNARSNLEQAQTQLDTTGKNLALVSEQYLADPGNASMRGAVQQATKDVESASIVRQQMEQSVSKYEVQLQEATETRDAVLDSTMTQLREQAAQEIAAETEQAAQEAQAQAQAQAQAEEEQRLVGNVNAVNTAAFMADNGYENVTDEQASQIGQVVAQPVEVSRANVEFASAMSRRFGVRASFIDDDSVDGAYDPKTKTVFFNRASTQGEMIYRFAAHELTHRAEASGRYNDLADALLQYRYGDDTAAREADLNALRAQYAAVYGNDDTAIQQELVAMAAQEVLGNEEIMQRMVSEKPSLARRVWEALKDFVNKLRGVNDPALETLRRAEKLLEKSLDEVRKKETSVLNKLGVKLLGDGTATKYSLSSWTPQEQEAVRQGLVNMDFELEDIDRWMNDVNSVAAKIAADKGRLDFDPAEQHTMLKHNQEYFRTLDASTLCAKRLPYQGTFNAVMRALPNAVLTTDDLIDLRNMMAEMDYDSPCAVCYVESRRRNLVTFAEQWRQSYEGPYMPTLDDVVTTDGLERMRTEHPEVYKSFNEAMSKKGSNNPKVVELRTNYRGEIRKLSNGIVDKILKIGGLRVQSFSDFETPHLLDMMQAVLDMAARDLTSQAYTKVPNFAWVFGDTGIKINLSLLSEGRGLDENGNLVFSSYEGMDINDAMALRDHYSANVGTILVGVNDDHIKAAMADPRIDYIIPYHRSGWSGEQMQRLSHGQQAPTDYQDFQSERRIVDHYKNGKPKYKTVEENFHPVGEGGYWDFSLSGKENAIKYLQMCKEDGRVPKFEQFLEPDGEGGYQLPADGSADGYWKMLIDFKMYDNDGNPAPQQPVRPNFNMEEAMRVLKEYGGGANELPVAQDVVDRFVKQYQGSGRKFAKSGASLPGQLLSKSEFRQFYDKIGEMMEGKSAQFHKAASGDYILEIGNKLVYTDGESMNPSISRIDLIDLQDATDIDAVVQLVYQSEDGEFTYEQARRIAESTFGREVLVRHDYGVHGTAQQRSGGTARGDGRDANRRGQKYAQSGVTLPSIRGGLEAQVQAWRSAPRAQQGQQPNRAERQFAAQTAQNSQAMPEDLRQELLLNDEQHYYDTDSNRAQLDRAWERYQQDGFDVCRDRILQAEHLTADDTAMANLLMALAFRSGDVNSAMELAHRYNVEGTAAAQALQARKIFSRMTPTGAKAWVAGKAETQLAEHRRTHKHQAQRIDEAAGSVKEDIQDKQGGDQLARLNAAREFTIDETNNRWGIPINEQQQALIDQYKLNSVRRPGVFYNRATTKQRMLEAILATPNPLELTGNGLNLIQRLEYLKAGEAVITNADLNYIGYHLARFAASDVDTQSSREGDLHLSRAYEAYGNIIPSSLREKARTWRYTSMLLSVPSAMRNVIGNTMQNTVNATANGIAVELDRIISKVTGERTKAHLTAAQRVEGWQAFVEETQNTFRDFFVDKAITHNGEDRFNMNQKGRVFQSQVPESLRLVESFLMSVGDRNFWKRAYVNSIAEQQRVAAENGVELDYEEAAVRATYEANYATFNEDNAVRDAFGMLKQVPVVGDVLDFIMPFTGVPTNIVSRMWQYSPMGLATSVIQHSWRGMTGQDFNQLDFVNGMSRGLTGTALFAAGMALASVGFLKLGTGEEEDKKVYGVESAQGKQYAPYIQIGDEYISLSAFAPAVSPLIAGAAAFDIFQADEDSMQALYSASTAMLDQIFDASYMSNLKDIFGGYGSIAENTANVVLSSAISQNIPSVISQIATALDPYVRDTKDKNALIQTLNAGLIQKIPGLREMLPEKVDVAGRSVESKEGLRNFVDPLTTTNATDDPALNELMRLYGVTGDASFFPSDALSGTKNSLSGVAGVVEGKDKEAYKKRYGELWRLGGTTYDEDGNRVTLTGVTDLINTPAYRQMTDEEKAEAISGIVSAAKAGATYEMGEKLGHAVKEASSDTGYTKKAVRAMPEQFAQSDSPMIQRLAEMYEQTGDGAFIPKGIGRSFSRDKVEYNLTDAEYEKLWILYEQELETKLAKIDWNLSLEEIAAAVESAYSSAASAAKSEWVKIYK